MEYRVLWKGYSKDESTWEPEEHLQNVDYMVQEFNEKLLRKQNKEKEAEMSKNLSKEKPTTHTNGPNARHDKMLEKGQ